MNSRINLEEALPIFETSVSALEERIPHFIKTQEMLSTYPEYKGEFKETLTFRRNETQDQLSFIESACSQYPDNARLESLRARHASSLKQLHKMYEMLK